MDVADRVTQTQALYDAAKARRTETLRRAEEVERRLGEAHPETRAAYSEWAATDLEAEAARIRWQGARVTAGLGVDIWAT
jgi:hypothetical protein